MATLTVRGIPDAEKEALRIRAARHGHSMEAEVRRIIREALRANTDAEEDLYTAIRRHVDAVGGFDIPEVEDTPEEPFRFK